MMTSGKLREHRAIGVCECITKHSLLAARYSLVAYSTVRLVSESDAPSQRSTQLQFVFEQRRPRLSPAIKRAARLLASKSSSSSSSLSLAVPLAFR